MVAVADFEGYVHWLSSDDGRFVARFRVGRAPIQTQALTDHDVFIVSSQSGVMAALRLDGK